MAWATPRSTSPEKIRFATSPSRIRPAAIMGLAASGPPDGLMRVSGPSPSASTRIVSWCVNGACNSATSTLPFATPAFCAAIRAEGATVRSRAPKLWESMRWSIPRIHAGRSAHALAVSPAASTIAAPPSEIGGTSEIRSGSER